MKNKIIDQAKSWLGRKESDGSHREIIDVYNAHKPLARGYKVKYTDAWCATFVSACAIKAHCTDVLPTECGCAAQINLFKKLGSWVEDDNYIPNIGDVIYYDWDDSGVGDNRGHSDHVGLVEKVDGNKITIIEGNMSNKVGRRVISVNGKTIRGYGVPKYKEITRGELDMTKAEFLDSLTDAECMNIVNKGRRELRKYGASEFAKAALDWAKENGLMVGDETGNQMPRDMITREQLVTVLNRFEEHLSKGA